jgi:hypothetical protein
MDLTNKNNLGKVGDTKIKKTIYEVKYLVIKRSILEKPY